MTGRGWGVGVGVGDRPPLATSSRPFAAREQESTVFKQIVIIPCVTGRTHPVHFRLESFRLMIN